jgi:RNA polymerase sigma-70 factor (ECF subfamily)
MPDVPAETLRLAPAPGNGPDAADVFSILLRDHAERLLVFLRASVPSSSVDDLFQDTVLVAWRRLPDYDRTRPFGAWLRGIARNLVMDHRSKMGRERPTDDALLDGIDRRAQEMDRMDREDVRARIAALDECVAALPDEYRTVIHLAYRLDAPVARIAAEVGSTIEATKKRLQRARGMLATCIEAKGAMQ